MKESIFIFKPMVENENSENALVDKARVYNCVQNENIAAKNASTVI